MDSSLDPLRTLLERLGVTVPPVPQAAPLRLPDELPKATPVLYQPTPGITCHCCDFRNLPVEPGTVSLVCTDIPYVREWLLNVPDFAAWCAKVLKPGGIMVTWYGQHHLNECMAALEPPLHYQWLMVSPLCGVNGNLGHPFSSRFQLALVYTNGTKLRLDRVSEDWTPGQHVRDLIPNDRQRDPGDHPHRKNLTQVQYLVEAFSQEGDLVCDPCSGGWTTAVACWHTNRQFVGSEEKLEHFEEARKKFKVLGL